MTQALTMTEAAERLAPVFEETRSFSAPARSAKGKWLSLERAGDVLAKRVKQPAPKRERAEEQIETPAELSEIRQERAVATATKLICLNELQEFTSRSSLPFDGVDETTMLASPEFMVVYGRVQQLRAAYEKAARDEFDVWGKQCRAENELFEAGRPDWDADRANEAVAMMTELGLSEPEFLQLWITPTPIDATSPVCEALARLVVGPDESEPVQAALRAVGFDDEEIQTAMSNETDILLRDHRIQELIARALDGYAPAEDHSAA